MASDSPYIEVGPKDFYVEPPLDYDNVKVNVENHSCTITFDGTYAFRIGLQRSDAFSLRAALANALEEDNA